MKDLVARFPEARELVDLDRTLASKTFWEFDDAATGPIHGFAGADDYYARSSSISFVGKIRTPDLCISAADDPFIPPNVPPKVRAAASPAVTCLFTQRGGHVGFVASPSPKQAFYWAEATIVRWLAGKVSETPHAPCA